jgi:hypothetical protein
MVEDDTVWAPAASQLHTTVAAAAMLPLLLPFLDQAACTAVLLSLLV